MVIKLEGGNDHDLRVLDGKASVSNTNVDNDEADAEPSKQTANGAEAAPLEQSSNTAPGSTTTSDQPSQSKADSEIKVCLIIYLHANNIISYYLA